MTTRKFVLKKAGTVMAATLVSRITGYARDMVIALFFGAGEIMDAFLVAYRIPNMLRNLFAEGAVSAAFIPVFTECIEKKGKKSASELMSWVFNFLVIAMLVVCTLGILFAPLVIQLIAPGFHSGQKALTVKLTRLMFPFIAFISFAALAMGILNSMKKFFLPAIASAVFNVIEITVLFSLAYTIFKTNPIMALSIGVMAGVIFQFLVQVPQVFSSGLTYIPSIDTRSPDLKKVFLLFVPVVLSMGLREVNLFVDTIFASFLGKGAVSSLYYSNRLVQLPLAMFAVSIATVALPLMSGYAADNDIKSIKGTFSSAMKLINITAIPSTVLFIVFGRQIIDLLFKRGAFDAAASGLTYKALVFYSVGLWSFSAYKIIVAFFYSLKDTKMPVIASGYCIIFNILFNAMLIAPLGNAGLALATSITSVMNFFVLFLLLRKRVGVLGGREIFSSAARIGISSLAMGICGYFSYGFIAARLSVPSLAGQIGGLLASFSVSAVAFLLAMLLAGSQDVKLVFSFIKRKTIG